LLHSGELNVSGLLQTGENNQVNFNEGLINSSGAAPVRIFDLKLSPLLPRYTPPSATSLPIKVGQDLHVGSKVFAVEYQTQLPEYDYQQWFRQALTALDAYDRTVMTAEAKPFSYVVLCQDWFFLKPIPGFHIPDKLASALGTHLPFDRQTRNQGPVSELSHLSKRRGMYAQNCYTSQTCPVC
jgi:hypothetical protein